MNMTKYFYGMTTFIVMLGWTISQTAGQTKISTYQTTPPVSQKAAAPVAQPQQPAPPNISRYPSPDDPNIESLLQQREQALNSIPDDYQPDSYIKKEEARRPVIEYLYDARQAELAKLRPKEIRTRPNLNVMDFPELDGSTSCSNLGMIAVCRALGVPYHWCGRPGDTTVSRILQNYYYDDGSLYRSPNPVYFDMGTKRLNEAQFVKFQVVPTKSGYGYRVDQVMQRCFGFFQGTHGSYLSLIGLPKNLDGTEIVPEVPVREINPNAGSVPPPILTQERLFPPSEILLVARKPSTDELEAARAARVELDVRPVALDAFVFLVNRKNPVENLTMGQLREIYYHCEKDESGYREGTNALPWSRYGGPNEKISVFERGFNSGSREIMDELVMNLQVNDPAVAERVAENRKRRYNPILDSMAGPYLALAGGDHFEGEHWGIAYSVYNYEHFLAATPEIRTLKIDGIMPNYETIRTKKYPLVSEMYVVTRKDIAADSPAAKLRDWLLSDDGQRTIRESGYVPINPNIAAE